MGTPSETQPPLALTNSSDGSCPNTPAMYSVKGLRNSASAWGTNWECPSWVRVGVGGRREREERCCVCVSGPSSLSLSPHATTATACASPPAHTQLTDASSAMAPVPELHTQKRDAHCCSSPTCCDARVCSCNSSEVIYPTAQKP
mgnify:CR=1 FL=1